MKILVTGANGDIAESIGRILRQRYSTETVDGADCNGTLPAACLFDNVHLLPAASSPEYVSAFHDLASSYDLTIPIPEAELLVLASQPNEWRRSLRLIMNEPSVISTFCDKLETSTWLRQCGDVCVETMSLADVTAGHLPVVVKPRFGWGSRGVQIVRSSKHLDLIRSEERGDWIAQTFLDAPEQEYTCAVIKDDAVVNTVTMLRSLQGGLTKQATVVWDNRIQQLLDAIADKLPTRAFINVQLRVFLGRPRVFEINPRFSSTAMMRHLVGFSDVIWAVDTFQGRSMKPAKARIGPTIIRLSREVVIDK